MIFDLAPIDDGIRRSVQICPLCFSGEQASSAQGFGIEILGRPGKAKLVYQPSDGDDKVHQRGRPTRQRLEERFVGAFPDEVAWTRIQAEGISGDDKPVAGTVAAEPLSQEFADSCGRADTAVGEDV